MHGAASGPATQDTFFYQPLHCSPDPAAVHDQAEGSGRELWPPPEQRMQVVSVTVFALNRAYLFAFINKQLPLPASSAHQDSGELLPGGQTHSFAGTV